MTCWRESVLAFSLPVLLLTGCDQLASVDGNALEAENTALKAEVAELKAELASLKNGSGQEEGSTQRAQGGHTGPSPFKDLDDYATKDIIDKLYELGMFGELGDTFDPAKPITRGEYITWLYKAHNMVVPESDQIRMAPQAKPFFSDLSPDHPSYKYVQAMKAAGFSVGYEDGTFKPDQPITREEMVAIKVGIDDGKAQNPDAHMMAYVWEFSDSKDVDNRYTGYIYRDHYVGGSKGGNIDRAFGKIGTFHPKQAVLRHEAAATLWQFDIHSYKSVEKALAQKQPH